MSSQQIEYPEAPVVVPDAQIGSPEEPTSAGTTDTSTSSNADYFDGHTSAAQVADVPDVMVSDRAAGGMSGHGTGVGGGGAMPGSTGGGKYDDMGKMLMGVVGSVAAASMSHGGGGGGYGGGGYGHHKKSGKSKLIATGAKMAMDMYNKKNGKPPTGNQPNMYGQGQPSVPYGAAPGMQQPYGMPPQAGHNQYPQQQPYGGPQQGYYGAPQGMPPYGQQGPHGYH